MGSNHQVAKVKAIWDEHLNVAKELPALTSAVSEAVDLICASLAAGGQLLVGGNGGSAADAQHIAAELTGRFFAAATTPAVTLLRSNGSRCPERFTTTNGTSSSRS